LEEEFPFEKEIEEPFIMLSLDIKHNRTLQEALAYYMRGEILDKENKFFVEKYQKRVTVIKKYQLKVLPECLVLTLNRFEFDLGKMMRKKLNNHFEFPEKFDFGFLEEGDEAKLRDLGQYRLTGVVVHSGIADAGHYWSYVFREGKWFEFNDANVTVKTEGAVS
jgi:ubiquitin C-terminal hydrolase